MKTLFGDYGIHALSDGQYGSTGKGALAGWLALKAHVLDQKFYGTISNAGPNSGHTFYHNGEKHVLKQLPTFAVASSLLKPKLSGESPHNVFLTAGAIIDPEILLAEVERYPDVEVFLNENAAVITDEDKEAERSGTVAAVAGTRSGTGAALARKVLRDPSAVVWGCKYNLSHPRITMINAKDQNNLIRWKARRYFLEVSQGFSLGINQQFYPKCTSRECTITQGMADAVLPPHSIMRSYLSLRTFPIRVGNVDGFSSGDCYSDQKEMSWEDFPGVEPERTTVTNRVRRIFSFSYEQLAQAMEANEPDFVFINFMNYLQDPNEFYRKFSQMLDGLGFPNVGVIPGHGPQPHQIGKDAVR